MNLVTLYIMQAGSRDEEISITRVGDTHDMYKVTYVPRDGATQSYSFKLSRSKVSDYIYDTLDLLSIDMYPYDSLQVMTARGPPVVVPIMDLECEEIRTLIAHSVLAALDGTVRSAKRSSE